MLQKTTFIDSKKTLLSDEKTSSADVEACIKEIFQLILNKNYSIEMSKAILTEMLNRIDITADLLEMKILKDLM